MTYVIYLIDIDLSDIRYNVIYNIWYIIYAAFDMHAEWTL